MSENITKIILKNGQYNKSHTSFHSKYMFIILNHCLCTIALHYLLKCIHMANSLRYDVIFTQYQQYISRQCLEISKEKYIKVCIKKVITCL